LEPSRAAQEILICRLPLPEAPFIHGTGWLVPWGDALFDQAETIATAEMR
jgi:hypothetical protein